jgi:hypothetical protein
MNSQLMPLYAALLIVFALGSAVGGGKSADTGSYVGISTMGNVQHFENQFPNVRVRLRLYRTGPAVPPRESFMEIRMKGARFRISDESGRDVSAILGDIAPKRGLGAEPRTIEDLMDIHSQALDTSNAAGRATELYGDLATNKAWVRRQGQEAWPIAATELAPAARLILAAGTIDGLERRAVVVRLGRSCTEYHGFLQGEMEGRHYRSEVTRIVSPPYLIENRVRDARDTTYTYVREIVALDEGVVTDSELTPP